MTPLIATQLTAYSLLECATPPSWGCAWVIKDVSMHGMYVALPLCFDAWNMLCKNHLWDNTSY